MADSYKNIAGHPLDLDDGSVVASGDFAKISSPGTAAQAHIDAGSLVLSPSGRAGSGGERTSSRQSEKTKEAS